MTSLNDITAQRGDDETYTLRVLESEGGPPMDLSAVQAIVWTIRRGPQEAIVAQKSLGAGVVVTDGPGGVARLELPSADTAPLQNRRITLVYDVELRDSAGRTSTLVRGRLVVLPDVTY